MPLPVRCNTVFRYGDTATPREVLASQRLRVLQDRRRRTLGDDLSTVHAGSRTKVDDVIGGHDGFLVMLDDDNGVADVP